MPLTGSDSPIKQAFDHASRMIGTALGPEVDQQMLQFAHTVQIDSMTQFMLAPSRDEHFPLSLVIQGFDRSGGMQFEKPVGLFADWSFVLCTMRGVIELHNDTAEKATEHLVMHDDVQIGDLIEDLGFTVTSLDRSADHTRLYDGTGQQVLLVQGYEYKVVRNWDGYSSFMADQAHRDCDGYCDPSINNL